MNPKIKAFIITLGFLLTSQVCFTQVSDSLFRQSYLHEDLIILKKDMEVDIVGLKFALMYARISTTETIIIKNEKGLEELNPIRIPKKLDNQFIYHASAVRNIDWAYDDVEIRYFNAKHSNSHKELKVNTNILRERILNLDGFFGEIYKYEYTVENLKVGDTVTLSYSYDIPFNLNWIYLLSNRIFFHGKYPIKEYQLKWRYNKNLEIDTIFANQNKPEVIAEENNLCYIWNLGNLPGCLDEPGGRPYKSLPYFLFVPQSYDLEYTHYNSFKMEFIPSYFFQSWDVQSKLYDEYWNNLIGNRSKDNLAYKHISEKFVAMAPNDSIGLTRMRYFQRYMVDSVTYDPAINYYSNNENHLVQRAGVDLSTGVVKDHNIERVYGNIIPGLGLDFFTAYPVDSRVGEISPQYTSTVKDNDLMIGVAMNNKTLGFVIPKSDKNLYYFEELPFYYEGIPVLLLHYTDFPNQLDKRNFNTNFRTVTTPNSGWKDNYRKTQSKVSVNLENNELDFQTRIMLSGQYSTLTRNAYNDLPVDSTINPKYFDPVWNISDDVSVKDSNMEHPQIYYPFKTTISSYYDSKNLIETQDSSFNISIGSWFKPPFYEGINNETRFLDYYPDFIGSDNYSYLLEFDKPIKLIEETDDIKILNDYANLSFTIRQMAENKLLLTYNYSILTRKVEKENINQVKQINRIIRDLENMKIKVSLTE